MNSNGDILVACPEEEFTSFELDFLADPARPVLAADGDFEAVVSADSFP